MSTMEVAIASLLSSSQLVIIGVACVFVPFFIYLIYRYSIKETSFEEVLEEQKQRSLEEEMRQKSEKSKKKEKFKRSWAKKKEKVEQEVIIEAPVRVEEIQQIPHIEIIEPKETKAPKQKSKKAHASPVISHNADANNAVEKPKKVEVAVGTEKQIQEKKKDASPVPEVQTEKVKAVSKAAEVLKTKVEAPVEKPSGSPPVPSKKKKKEVVEKESIPLSASKLLSLIKDVPLDTEEIQNLIDILLNKQKDSVGWTKPNDQLADTKRNLHEREQQLDLELKQNQAVVSKLKDLREEYNQLKVKYSSLEKNSQEKIARQQQDIQNFNARVKQLQEQCTADKEKSAQSEKQAEESVANALKNVEHERVQLQQKLSKLEAEARSGVSKAADIDAVKKSKDDLQKVHALLIDQHTQLVNTHKTDLKNLNLQLVDIKKKFEEVNAKNVLLVKDVQSLKDTKAALEVSKKSLEDLLQAEKKHVADLEAQGKQLSSTSANLGQLQAEVKNLQLENERLAEQLVSNKERVAGDGQEIVHQNGEMNGGKVPDEALRSLEEKELLLKEKDTLLVQLNDDLVKLKAKITVLDEETEIQRKKNNELREKNYKVMEALKQAEDGVEQKVKVIQAAAEKKLSEVQKEYEEKLLANNNSQTNVPDDLAKRIEEEKAESAKRLQNYESEKEKNKQLTSEVDRLSAQEKSTEYNLAQVKEKVQDLYNQIQECQTRTRECLQRIHPEVSIDSSLPHISWLAEFEKQASSSINNEELTTLKALLEEKERHYQSIISDTDSILHSLQGKIEETENRWQERFKEVELKHQQIVAEMESTFQKEGQQEEIKEQLKELQSVLQTAESERSHSEQKYEEVQRNCLNLRDQLENKELQIKELQNERNNVERLNKELEDVKSKLEIEKKTNKDFSSQMVRLNSLVKIGTDSLSAEQDMVKKLKSQLEASQVSATNGGTTTALSTPVGQNEDASVKK